MKNRFGSGDSLVIEEPMLSWRWLLNIHFGVVK